MPRGDAVHGADEGALPAADHAEPDRPLPLSRSAAFDRHGLLLDSRSRVRNAAIYDSPSIALICFLSVPAAGEIVERLLGDADDVVLDERRALARAVLGMLQRAFPFEHRPAVVIVLRELGEDAAEIDLAVAQRAEAAGPVDPALIAAIDALPAGRIELGVLHVERLDALVIDVDEGEIVELLQHEVRRVVVDVAARGGPSTRSRNISKVTPSSRSSPGWIS